MAALFALCSREQSKSRSSDDPMVVSCVSSSPAATLGCLRISCRNAAPYRLRIFWPQGVQETEDPYSFGLLLGDIDLHLFNEGRHFQLAQALGAEPLTIGGAQAFGFPYGRRTRDGSRSSAISTLGTVAGIRCGSAMAPEFGSCFCHVSRPGSRYKYDIISPDGVHLPWKAIRRPANRNSAEYCLRRASSPMTTPGMTSNGCQSGVSGKRPLRRSRFMKFISALG